MDGKQSRSKSGGRKKHQDNLSSVSEEEKTFVEKMKKKATVKTYGIDNASTFEHPASFSGTTKELDKVSLKHFIENSDIEILSLNDEEIIFDLVGVEPPLANALRRILIAEIPTMAIEKVNMWQNTSIIPDENLAHRMGLIPIKADPRDFEYHEKSAQENDQGEQHDSYTENDSIRFKLHVRCTKKDPRAPVIINNTVDEEKLYNNANVYSSQLIWQPVGNQLRKYGEDGIKPLFGDILIAKLRPGQEIEMELICEKGIGKTHAKWSPVSTAYYRLVPDIKITQEILNEEAVELKNLCPTGVFDIEDLGKKGKRAVVGDVRKCTTCRECIRPEKFRDRIDLSKIKDRFEFHVESVGILPPEVLVIEALKKLKEKANYWLEVLEQDNEVDDEDEQHILQQEDKSNKQKQKK